MDYLTKFYKNQSEVLAEKVQILEKHLAFLSEAEAPASVFRGTGQGQQRFSDLELEAQMRRFKTTGFFGAEVADDKQRQEYRDAKAELERRRGAGKQQAPAPAPASAPRPPVEQMGPKGSPSAVPTKTEVQKTQAVADQTGVPTALPTNTAPGTMSMTDMDGNPIAVQPRPKQSEGPVLGRVEPAQNTPQGRRELERSAMGKGENRFVARPTPADFNMAARANAPATDIDSEDEYQTNGGYLQSPISWRSRYPENYQTSPKPASSDNMVQRAFSVPSRAPGTMVNPSDLTAVKLPSGFHRQPAVDVSEPSPSLLDRTLDKLLNYPQVYKTPSHEDMVKAIRDDAANLTQTNFNMAARANAPATDIDSEDEYQTKGGYLQSPTSWRSRYPENYQTSPKQERVALPSAVGTPPSAQYAPRESQVERPKETGIAAIPPVSPQEIQNRDTKNERMVSDTARQALPSAVRDVVKQPAEEDFSKFWAGKPRYGDLELQNMLRQHRRTAIGGKELPLERQSIEYRAARAELMRRGKLKP